MAKSAVLAVKEGQVRQTINTLLRDLLSKKVVRAVLVPLAHPAGNNVVPALVTDPEHLEQADVLAPVFPVNLARIASTMTRLAPVSEKMAVVIRPCDLRALIELVKLKQAQLDNVVLIGVDCPGAYSVKDYPELAGQSTSDDFVKAAWQGKEDDKLRAGCQICEYPVPLTADLTIGLIGVDLGQGLLLRAETGTGEQILEGLGLSVETDGEMTKKREAAVKELLERMKQKREQFFAQTKEEAGGLDKLLDVFGPCIKCQNCRTVCPVCYCRECFFESPTFDLEGDRYLAQAKKTGAMRMPTDTLLFHLTRMTHMGSSCIGCGMCEEACPSGIPLLEIFQMVGSQVQKLFDYTPGRSVEDELPLATFKEDELEWVGEK